MTELEEKLQLELAKEKRRNDRLEEKIEKLGKLNDEMLLEYFFLSRKLNQIERDQDKKYPLLSEVQP